MNTFTFDTNPFQCARGDQIRRVGHSTDGDPTIVSTNEKTLTVVVHYKGYSYNPGSRNSMLKGYTPAEIVVYHSTGERNRFGSLVFTELVSYAPRG